MSTSMVYTQIWNSNNKLIGGIAQMNSKHQEEGKSPTVPTVVPRDPVSSQIR